MEIARSLRIAGIIGGTVDGVVIGSTTPAGGSFTTFSTSGISTFNDDVLVPTGNVHIGVGSASHSGVTPLFQIHTTSSIRRLSGTTYFNDDAAGPIFSLAKSKSDTAGTIVHPASGDNLGGIWWEGANEASSRFDPGAKVFAIAGSTWTASNRESDLIFQTVSSGATGLTTALTLSSGNAIFAGDIGANGNALFVGDIGFYGQTATAKPTGVAVTATGIHGALVTLNLIAA